MEQNTVRAKLKNLKLSPQKMRLLAALVRGKRVDKAINALRYVNKKGSLHLGKLILSAAANAEENKSWDKENLVITEVQVGDAIVAKRVRAANRGRRRTIFKRYCHIYVELTHKPVTSVTKPKTTTKKVATKAKKKVVTKKKATTKKTTKKTTAKSKTKSKINKAKAK